MIDKKRKFFPDKDEIIFFVGSKVSVQKKFQNKSKLNKLFLINWYYTSAPVGFALR